ncbi:hypothetical protein Droror1_Dr00019323 [Drosera rotundifolia]
MVAIIFSFILSQSYRQQFFYDKITNIKLRMFFFLSSFQSTGLFGLLLHFDSILTVLDRHGEVMRHVVAKWAREKSFLGRDCLRKMDSAPNVVLGHHISFGPAHSAL